MHSVKQLLFCFMLISVNLSAQVKPDFNVAAFGKIRYWNAANNTVGIPVTFAAFNNLADQDTFNIGMMWWEPRDIQRVEIQYAQKPSSKTLEAQLQYWQETWPQEPPHMPTIDDLDDDPWKGKWITAATAVEVNGNKIVYYFKPMTEDENKNANFLPEPVTYRRAVKLRLIYPQKPTAITAMNIFSMSQLINKFVRIEMGVDKKLKENRDISIEVFNGHVKNIKGWNTGSGDKRTGSNSFRINFNNNSKGIIADISATKELLPGSNDETIVTVRSLSGTYSFSIDDLEKEPVYIPYYNVYISKADDPAHFSPGIVKGKTIRERIPEVPEQSYDRARNEIPHLDPWKNQYGNKIYLPLATDGNWQKFAVEWGGDIFLNKRETKAQGKELARCNWNGTILSWKFGAGNTPDFERNQQDCQMSFSDDYIPVIRSVWRKDGLIYNQEFVATMLSGPLSPFDAARDEQTPAVLLVKFVVSNPTAIAKQANIWLKANGAVTGLSNQHNFLMDDIGGQKFVRCFIQSSNGNASIDEVSGNRTVKQSLSLAPNSSTEVFFYFPFVGDLTEKDQVAIASLNYEKERNKVAAYWREVVNKNLLFNVPERKFNEMAKAVIPHIRMSATKDPKSGLFMVPASSLGYGVYANEACYQTFLLDRMGDFNTSAAYLNTFVQLQGTRSLPGDFTGSQQDVYYGVRVDSVYDQTFNGYNMHHSVTLWALSRHYLNAKNNEWLKANASSMKRAADWLIKQRSHSMTRDENNEPVRHYGLLPAGVLEDPEDWQHWYTTNAYGYIAIKTMAKAFEQAGLPEAAHYKNEAAAFYKDIRRSVEIASEHCPVIRLRNGTYVPYVPIRPYQRFRYFGVKKRAYYERYKKNIYPTLRLSATREVLYGPIVLIKNGIISADEPMADWILNDWEDNITMSTSLNLNAHGWVDDEYWFSRGGMVFQANLQNPVPVYLSKQDIPAAIRGVYNNFVSCLYPEVNVFTEEYRKWVNASGPFYKIPDESRAIQVISEMLVLEKEKELLLAAGTPRRWLEPGQHIELINAFTEYGQLHYTIQPGKIAETIEADIDLTKVDCPSVQLFIRAPFQKPIKSVILNGAPWQHWDAVKERITIPAGKRSRLVVSY
ncbi:MAG: hypothetical protein J0I84_03035 [Terrimonas sp.]|nr:hypothetical protein [Terrimonas sp.]